MNELTLLDDNLLPAITPEDNEFALKIVKEFPDLVFEGITWLIRDVRYELENNLSDFRSESSFRPLYKELKDKLFATDAEIQELKITTNKGEIIVKSSDPFFNLFSMSITRIKKRFDGELNQEENYIKKWSEESPYNRIMIFFLNTSLIPFQRNIAIGKFLVYFNLFCGGDPLMTEQEFNSDPDRPASYQDYNHYLYERVKSRLKVFLSE